MAGHGPLRSAFERRKMGGLQDRFRRPRKVRASVKILGKTVVHATSKFDLAVHSLRTDHGETIERAFLDHPGAVVILPLLPEDQVVLLRNYRHALDKRMLELPAGTRIRGEDFQECAERELTEETGYQAGSWREVTRFYPAPGASSELMVLYVAEDLTAGVAQLEPDEELEPVVVELAEALAMTRDGRIRDAKTMLGLWWLEWERNRSEGRA